MNWGWKIFPRDEYVNVQQECPFCDMEHIKEYCLYETAHLRLLRNKYPYVSWMLNHYLIIPHRHIQEVVECNKKEIEELLEIHQELEKLYSWEKHLVLQRYGDGTVDHLHWHCVPVSIDASHIIKIVTS